METTIPKLITRRKLMERLGVTKKTLFAWIQDGRIPPPIRTAGRLYWKEDDIVNWINAGMPAQCEPAGE